MEEKEFAEIINQTENEVNRMDGGTEDLRDILSGKGIEIKDYSVNFPEYPTFVDFEIDSIQWSKECD